MKKKINKEAKIKQTKIKKETKTKKEAKIKGSKIKQKKN